MQLLRALAWLLTGGFASDFFVTGKADFLGVTSTFLVLGTGAALTALVFDIALDLLAVAGFGLVRDPPEGLMSLVFDKALLGFEIGLGAKLGVFLGVVALTGCVFLGALGICLLDCFEFNYKNSTLIVDNMYSWSEYLGGKSKAKIE